jgi:hypothetical protein
MGEVEREVNAQNRRATAPAGRPCK